MDNKSKNTMIVSVIALALVLIGVTYAYFSARITGLESASTISLTAGRMGIQYSEGDEEVTFTNIYPREEAWATKTFTLTGWNTTDQSMYYEVGLNVITNTFTNDYLTYDLRVLESTNGTPVASKTGVAINGTGFIKFGKGVFTDADGDVHRYELKIYFKDNGLDQNDSQGAIFNARINVVEKKDTSLNLIAKRVVSYTPNYDECMAYFESFGEIPQEELAMVQEMCTNGSITEEENGNQETITLEAILHEFGMSLDEAADRGIINVTYENYTDNELVDEFEYNYGSYVYTLHKTRTEEVAVEGREALEDVTIDLDPSEYYWSAALINNSTVEDTFNEQVASTINGMPVSDLSSLFDNNSILTLDLSSFDTSNVTNMSYMFRNSQATNLDLSSFDTSKVTNMDSMFYSAQATSLDLSSFDTSNVTNMSYMFRNSQATSLDLSSFDTSNVTNMGGMFSQSSVRTIYARTTSDAQRFCDSTGGTENGTDVYADGNMVCQIAVITPDW